MTEENKQPRKDTPEGSSRRNFLLLVALASAVGASFGKELLGRLATHAVDRLESAVKQVITACFDASHRSHNRNVLAQYLQDAGARKLQVERFGLHNGRVAITTGRNTWRSVDDESRIFGATEHLPPFVMSTAVEFVKASRQVMTADRGRSAGCPGQGLRVEESSLTAPQKSAEGIVGTRQRAEGLNGREESRPGVAR